MTQARLLLAAVAVAAGLKSPALAQPPVRVATFNLALYGTRSGEILDRLNTGADAQAQHLAEIIQRVRPDILVLNEIDYDPDAKVLSAFHDKYLAVPQASAPVTPRSPEGSAQPTPDQPLDYPHRYIAPPNTGHHSGFDLDRNGRVDPAPGSPAYGADCWGYGVYEGQYAFAVLSRYPIDRAAIRTFQRFLWRDMPGALLPDDPKTPAPADWYSAECLEKFPLSSKNHCDVPIDVAGRRLHLLLSHPTPPVFDGPEDRNGRRNQDELRFWIDYVADHTAGAGIAGPADYIYDDTGLHGGLVSDSSRRSPGDSGQDSEKGRGQSPGAKGPESVGRNSSSHKSASPLSPGPSPLGPRPSAPSFLILGDLNGDPHDGQGKEGISALLASPRILKYDFPASAGATEAARLDGGVNATHQGDPQYDTEDAADERGPGNLHLDYILPSADLAVAASGVFWPETSDPLHALVAGGANPASSDHRLVWIDLAP